MCGTGNAPAGTLTTTSPPQVAGDCHQIQCDGSGGTTTVVDDTDSNDNNSCTTDGACANGAPSHTALADGLVCADSSAATRCRGGSCVAAFSVVRAGDGTNALSTASAALQLEDRYVSDGALVAEASNPLALPTAASGAQDACTNAGQGGSGELPLEGFLARSVDEHSLTLACYNAAPLVAAIASTAASATNRVVAHVDSVRAIDTTTHLPASFSANSVRSAVTTDGSHLWVAGSEASASGTGGVWYTTLGASGGTQLTDTPPTVQVAKIFGDQLYGSSDAASSFPNVFAIGSGEPVSAPQTCTALPGMPTGTTATALPSDFALVTVGTTRTLYVADRRTASNGGGVEKWTFDGSTWHLVTTFDGIASGDGIYALTAYVAGTTVIVVAVSSATTGNVVVSYTDDGATTPAATTLATAPANTGYRGIALAPH